MKYEPSTAQFIKTYQQVLCAIWRARSLGVGLKKEVIELQLRQMQPMVLRSMLFERNVKELEFVQTV